MEFKQLFAKKPLQLLLDEMRGEHRLRRVLGPVQLTSLGIGCIIGTGIFVLVGKAAHDTSGPALMLSFVVAGLACIFAALCYAEFASIAPVAGSAYTYAYATLGELFAWIIGWDLVLEYTVASATVSHGWSKYFQDFLKIFGVTLPEAIRTSPIEYKKVIETVPETGLPTAVYRFFETGSVLDLPALMIALLITAVLVKGIRESASFNAAMVITKVVIVIFVIVVGAFYINPSNWTPFAPYGWTGISFFGWTVAGTVDRQAANRSESSRAPASSSLPTSVSIRSRRTPRRRATHSATCRSESSRPSSSAPFCTLPWLPCSRACCPTRTSTLTRRSRTPSVRKGSPGRAS
jgi:APA family basic amino acid/polyamine antiporter